MIFRLTWENTEDRRSLYQAAILRGTPQTEPGDHGHDFYEFFLVLEGRGGHFFNGERVQLHPGLLAFIGPEDHHYFKADDGPSFILVNVSVSADWWNGFQTVAGAVPGWELKGQPRSHFELSANLSDDLYRLILRLMDPEEPSPTVLFETWRFAMTATYESSNPALPTPPAWLENLRNDLCRPEWLLEPISFWQKRSGRTPEHLARSCRKFYGVPLTELINRKRIERVKFLLLTSDAKITQTAFDAGFNNLAHFYRIFQRLTGKTPRQWREQTMHSVMPPRR